MTRRATSAIDRSGGTWQKIRQRVFARDRGQCVLCGGTSKLEADHILPREFGGTDDMRNLQTLCIDCHKRKTAAQAGMRSGFYGEARNPTPAVKISLPQTEPSVKLNGNEAPGSPRFWPDPHPLAVGTRGAELAEYAENVIGQPLLPWQRMVADELLQVDADGRWCHSVALLLVPRQSGKSTLLRALCEWLASQGQVVGATSARLANVAHLMRPTQLRHRQDADWHILFSKEQPEVNWPGWTEDTHRWIGQAATSMFGRGFTMGTVVIDEVQDVQPEVLEAVSPSLIETDNPLVIMTGTAPRVDSAPLLSQQRQLALEGGPVALFEWSAPPGSDWRDEETWRAASPRWTPARLRYLRKETSKSEPFFRSEYLCQPQAGSSDPWLDLSKWRDARQHLDLPAHCQVACVEDGKGGEGGSVALAWSQDGKVHVVALTTPTLAEAWALSLRADRVLCGLTLRNEPAAKETRAQPRGKRETGTALPEVRRLLLAGQLVWDGDDLDHQARTVQVREDSAGTLTVAASVPSGALRTAAWAVQATRTDYEPVLV